MSKILKTVGAIIGTIVSFIPGGQLIGAAIIAGTSLISNLIAKKPVPMRDGIQLQFKIDPGGPIPYLVGRTATAGTIVYRDTYGKDNHFEGFVSVLSGAGPVDAIESMSADRTTVTYSGQSATGYYAEGVTGTAWMWQDTQVGLTPEIDALHGPQGLAGPFGTIPAQPNWGASYKLSGYAAVNWTLLFDTKSRRYANGEPSPLWIVRGVKVYDPRRDSTYPGGSGSCRWADPSDTAAHAAARATWVYSETPSLHALMWRLGIWHRNEADSAAKYQKVMGIGAPIGLIDLPAIVNAANVQEANGWKVGGVFSSEQDRWEVLKFMEQAGGAEPMANGALMSVLVKAPQIPVATITADDLADGPLSAPAMRTRSDRLTGYRAKFRSEPHGWEITPIDIIEVPAYIAADGRRNTGSGEFSYVQDPDQCAELAAYEVFDSREIDGITLSLKPFATAFKLGTCLTIDIPELGLPGVDVIVRGKTTDVATASVQLTVRTETPAKHAAALGLTGTAPPTPTLTSAPDSVIAPDTGSWALSAITPDGVKMTAPSLLVSGAVDNSRADAIVFEYRKVGDPDWITAGTEPVDLVAKTITAGIVPGYSYEAAVRYRARGILSDRYVIGPVTALGTTNTIINVNLVRFSGFEQGFKGWFAATTGTQTAGYPITGTYLGKGLIKQIAEGFSGASRFLYMTQTSDYYFPVVAGQRYAVQARIESQSLVGTVQANYLRLAWYDGAGAYITETDVQSGLAGPQTYGTLMAGFVTAPAGSVKARIVFYVDTVTTGQIEGALYEPMVTVATPEQTQFPAYSPGQNDPLADQTIASQITLAIADVNLAASSTGVITSGQLPKVVSPILNQGSTSIVASSAVTWSVDTISSNLTGQVSVSNSSGTKGQVTIGIGVTGSGTFRLVATISGVPYAVTVAVNVNRAGGTFGGNPTKNASGPLAGYSLNNTTTTEIARFSSMVVASGETIYCTASGDYSFASALSGTSALVGKWQYSLAGANSWTDIAGFVTGTAAGSSSYAPNPDGQGSITVAQNKSGLSANTYDVRFVAARQSSSPTGSVTFDSGTLTVGIS